MLACQLCFVHEEEEEYYFVHKLERDNFYFSSNVVMSVSCFMKFQSDFSLFKIANTEIF
jgi:hypothetical protein